MSPTKKSVIIKGYRTNSDRNDRVNAVEQKTAYTIEEFRKAQSELSAKVYFLDYEREDGTPIEGWAENAIQYLQ
ncbi:hypothetical protein HY407_03640 [Candidatus Gottesmanbacteria bacterium]|nr:hypothetical protein [Candidatus Gottesmanbacteria bacterium]